MLDGAQGRSGRVRKISPHTGIPFPDRPARSKSQYRLSYPGPYSAQVTLYKWETLLTVNVSGSARDMYWPWGHEKGKRTQRVMKRVNGTRKILPLTCPEGTEKKWR
jgi:hypothetical protein